MKENELIGIVGVFVLTFCLIALYHLIGKFGRHNKRYDAQTKRARDPEQDWRPGHDPRRTSGKDDAWLLWSPELDKPAGASMRGFPDQRESSVSRLRS